MGNTQSVAGPRIYIRFDKGPLWPRFAIITDASSVQQESEKWYRAMLVFGGDAIHKDTELVRARCIGSRGAKISAEAPQEIFSLGQIGRAAANQFERRG